MSLVTSATRKPLTRTLAVLIVLLGPAWSPPRPTPLPGPMSDTYRTLSEIAFPFHPLAGNLYRLRLASSKRRGWGHCSLHRQKSFSHRLRVCSRRKSYFVLTLVYRRSHAASLWYCCCFSSYPPPWAVAPALRAEFHFTTSRPFSSSVDGLLRKSPLFLCKAWSKSSHLPGKRWQLLLNI